MKKLCLNSSQTAINYVDRQDRKYIMCIKVKTPECAYFSFMNMTVLSRYTSCIIQALNFMLKTLKQLLSPF